MEDTMLFTILEDGTVRTEVDRISGANHAAADAFVQGVDALLGTKASIAKRAGAKHHHEHEHTHEHTSHGGGSKGGGN